MAKIGIRCEKCGTLVEKELPWPNEKIVERVVKEPCRCGMTTEARTSRHWATVAAILIIIGLPAAAASCHSSNVNDAKKVEVFKNQYKVEERADGLSLKMSPTVVEKNTADKLRDRAEENARYRDDAAFWRTANENLRLTNQELRERIDQLQAEIKRISQKPGMEK